MRTMHKVALAATVAALQACGGGGPATGGGNGGSNDTQAPTATLTAPAALASNLGGTLALTATATDNVGVASVEFQVDGATVATVTTGAFQAGVDTTAYASGQHVVRVRSLDAAGNTSPWSSATVQFGGTRTQPATITRTSFVSGLTNATAFARAQAPDGRLFVAEQGGTLRIVLANGTLLATPFMTLAVDATGERGLIGVTLDPAFATNRYLYVYFTTPEGGTHNRISRFTALSSNPNIVDPTSEMRIADLPALSSATNHNGGVLRFGGDGKLYVGVGDNANGAQAPDLNLPFGKVLRFNVDAPLSIPNNNPFCTTASTLKCAVWAKGLRNPYTMAVRGSDGRIHINDVGENTWEEIDLGVAGADYGWPSTEGATTAAGITAPLYAYDHTAGTGAGDFFSGCAITGGTFYPASGPFPAAYRDSYYFADFCGKWIARLDTANGNAAYAFGSVDDQPVDLLTGIDGALYVLGRSTVTRFGAP
jgi:glucose/arabinose dehydrogenase